MTDTISRVHAMAQTVISRDVAELGKIAHALAGAAANVGAVPLAKACSQLERECNTPAMPAQATQSVQAIALLSTQSIEALKVISAQN